MAVDLEKITRSAAVARGVETFIELTMFYGLLFSIALYDLAKRKREGQHVQECL